MVIEATKETFNELISEAGVPILIDFYASWCGPCKMIAPILHNIKEKYKDKVKIVKVDTEKYPDITALFDVRNLPTLVLIYDGVVVNKTIGFKRLEEIENFIFS